MYSKCRINQLQQPGWIRHLYDILLLIGFGFPTLLQLSTRAQPWQPWDLSWIPKVGKVLDPQKDVDLWQTLKISPHPFCPDPDHPHPALEQGLTSQNWENTPQKSRRDIPIFWNQKLLDVHVLNNNTDTSTFFKTHLQGCLCIECPGTRDSPGQSAKQIYDTSIFLGQETPWSKQFLHPTRKRRSLGFSNTFSDAFLWPWEKLRLQTLTVIKIIP